MSVVVWHLCLALGIGNSLRLVKEGNTPNMGSTNSKYRNRSNLNEFEASYRNSYEEFYESVQDESLFNCYGRNLNGFVFSTDEISDSASQLIFTCIGICNQ